MNFINKIIYAFIVVIITMAGNSYANAQAVNDQCEISDIYFEPQTEIKEDTEVTLTIAQGHEDCATNENEFNLWIVESGDVLDRKVYSEDLKFHSNGKPIILTFKLHNSMCDDDSENDACEYFVDIRLETKQGSTISYSSDYDDGAYTSDFFTSEALLNRARISIPCKDDCEKDSFELLSIENDSENTYLPCRVRSVKFDTFGENIDPNFIGPSKKELLGLEIVTVNCNNEGDSEEARVYIRTKGDSSYDSFVLSTTVAGIIPPDGIINIKYIPGDESCGEELDGKDYCNYGVFVRNKIAMVRGYKIFESEEGPVGDSMDKIGYYCENTCGENKWSVFNSNLIGSEANNPEVIPLEKQFGENSPCYTTSGSGDETKKEYKENCYEPLAALPGTGGGAYLIDEKTNRPYINFETFQLGDYVNFIFKTTLGVLIVLAVIMIIIAGVEYMTVESVYGKSNARTRITNAVTGLLLALGIFTILSTINPKLLEINFTAPAVKIDIQSNQNVEGESTKEVGVQFKQDEGDISSGLNEIKESLSEGVMIKKISISGDEGSTRGLATIELENGEKSSSFPVGFGKKGITSKWTTGSKKTPVGAFTLGVNRYDYSKNGEAVLTYDKKNNMGPAFISIDQSPYFGVGIHGKAEANSLGTTYGCVRVRNEDLTTFMKNIDPGSSEVEITLN